MQAATGRQELQAPAIAITPSRGSSSSSSSDVDHDASHVLTPTASRAGTSNSHGPSSLSNSATQQSAKQSRPTPLQRLSGLPKGLKLNLKKGSNRNALPSDPLASPLGLLCVRVIAARHLTSKDRNGKSDPWVRIKVADCRAESEVVKASLNPLWGEPEGISKAALGSDGSVQHEAFVVAPVWPETLLTSRIEIILWDKDTLKKDEYLGEVCVSLEDLAQVFREKIPIAYGAADNQPFWRNITSSKSKSKVSGDVLIKIGWLAPPMSDLGRTESGSSSKSVAAEPLGLALATKTTILASRTSLAKYANENPLSEQDTVAIRQVVMDQLRHIIDASPEAGKNVANQSGKSDGGKLGWVRLRRKRRENMQERVFTAPPNEGVGTLRLDQSPHGALSNELTAGDNIGSSSDSSSPAEDYDEDEASDSELLNKDDASATSDTSSIADLDELDEDGNGPADYFNLAMGMEDTPKVATSSAADFLRPDGHLSGVPSGSTSPDDSEKKKKRGLIPKVFKRTPSSKSVEKLSKNPLKPELLTQDSFVSDTGSAGPSEPPSGATTPNAFRRKKFTRRKVYLNADDSNQVGAVDLDGARDGKKKKKHHKRQAPKTGRRRKASQAGSAGLGGYSLSTGAMQNDFLGVVFVEVKGANNLPRWRNVTRTGWDMDPFCIISFGQKVFRTRVIRHSRNPVWDERLFFHVQRHEHAFQMLFSLFDWDKMSSNDFVGEVPLLLSELNSKAAQPDAKTGLFPVTPEGKIVGDELYDYVLPLSSKSAELEDSSKEQPTITIRAKFTPYSALRQRFWRTYLKQYDTDDSGTWSYVEIYSLLDSLGSTLTRATIDTFFTRFGKSPDGTLTAEEAIVCLEDELTKPRSEKREVELAAPEFNEPKSGTVTPSDELASFGLADNAVDGGLDFTGLPVAGEPKNGVPYKDVAVPKLSPGGTPLVPGSRTTSSSSSTRLQSVTPFSKSGSTSPSDQPMSGDNSDTILPHELERVINIKTCPLCHKKLSKKAEVDMVSHLAVCASQDWSSLDSLTVANFVSTSQAHRKWLTKLVTKVSHGTYKLGADSANIIVQDRMTGQLLEEKMQVYVRLGIRLWYRAAGSSSRMEANRIRKLLRSMTLKQGIKFDSPESVAEIPRFIAYHKLDLREVRDPIDSFKNFNSFFYRKLKPEARPLEDPDDPRTLVSGADCRMTAFQTVTEATSIWIKGRAFSIKRLLGEPYKDDFSKFEGGSLCIFRLAPQDYHRYHSSVDGTIGKMNYISGEYYTVNPIAIRSSLDVYAENARVIVPMDSKEFGRVYNVCIGAMMVGSINFTKHEGDFVKRGEEYGYFAFGGSTIVCLFEPNTVQFDKDILQNSAACIETLVRVGMRIGRSVRKD